MTTVLLVEDSLTDAELLSSHLKQLGLAVVTVNTGEDAHAKIESRRPDLIVLDVILPGRSGFELCRELKNNPTTKDIPVVMCSSKGTDADKMWGGMLGADAYLSKPVTQADVTQVIQKFVK